MTSERQIYEGYWYNLKNPHYIACCDCSLTHRFEFKSVKGKLKYRVFREKDITEELRAKGPFTE